MWMDKHGVKQEGCPVEHPSFLLRFGQLNGTIGSAQPAQVMGNIRCICPGTCIARRAAAHGLWNTLFGRAIEIIPSF